MSPARDKVRMSLFGPFRLSRSNHDDCTPRGRKSCALLALVALAPSGQRSRKWLQDKLWSDRGDEQGAASLRQCLVEIRRALGDERDVLRTTKTIVSIDRTRVDVDLDDWPPHDPHDAGLSDLEFLEGLDVRDPEFENWLRDERRRLSNRLEQSGTPGDGPDRQHPRAPDQSMSSGSPAGVAERLIIARASRAEQDIDHVAADWLLDSIAKTVSEHASVRIINFRHDVRERDNLDTLPADNRSLVLEADVAGRGEDGLILRALLSRAGTREIVWSTAVGGASQEGGPLAHFEVNSEELLRHANQTANVAIDEYLNLQKEAQSQPTASTLCREGMLHLFRLGGANFEIADQLFARAFNLQPRGIYLAWRAYLRTIMIAERQFVSRTSVAEEAMEFLARALEMEPHNSFVMSFAAQVHYIIKRSYVAAYEFAERSVQLNPANSLGWAELGTAKAYLGKLKDGIRDTRFALQIAGAAPYRYQLLGQNCIVNSMAHQIEEAIQMGETSHALLPTFAPAIRYLSVLYLEQRADEKSWEMVQKLRALEPDFSYDVLRDPDYPSAGMRRSGLLELLPRKTQ